MPTQSQLQAARTQILSNLGGLYGLDLPTSTNLAQLALLSLIADSGGGGGGGGSSGTEYAEGATDSPSTGTVLLFRRTDGTLKALQGDNSDRLKIVGDVSLSTGTSVDVGNFPNTFAATQSGDWSIVNVTGTVSLPTGAATDTMLQSVRDRLPTQQGTWVRSATTTTNATQNTWTQALEARATRVSWVVANLSDTAIQVGYGGTGSEQVYLPVPAGGAVGQSINQVNFSNADVGVISVRCVGAASKAISVSEVYL